jgi:hypothetical protein
MVMVMKHVCPDAIQSEAAFDALGGFLAKVAACPVITMPGDDGPAGALDAGSDFFDQHVDNGQTAFDFTVVASDGTRDLAADAMFEPAKVCETDVNVDIDGDGTISATTCLEVSHYALDGVAEGSVSVMESSPPAGFRFGSIEFTPGSGDDSTLVSVDAATGTVMLDTTQDDGTSGSAEAGPHVVMVHVYNFANVESSTPTPTATSTPSGGVEGATGTPRITPPSTDTSATGATRSASNDGFLLVLAGMGVLLAAVAFATQATRRRAHQRIRRDR